MSITNWLERQTRCNKMWTIQDYIEGKVSLGEKILCPFHNDHSPSAICLPVTGVFYCFVCQARGDQVEIAKRLWFPEENWKEGLILASALLRYNNYPIITSSFDARVVETVPQLDPELLNLMDRWVKLCNKNLEAHPEIVERIRQTRAIQDPVGLHLGLASYDVFKEFRKEDINETYAIQASIVYEKDEREISFHQRYRLSDRIIIPEIREGKAIYFQSRAQQREHKLRYLNPKGIPRPVYGWESLKRQKPFVWFVEGVFDMLPLLEAGESVISCNGLGFNDRILGQIKEVIGDRTIAVAFDNDSGKEENRGYIEGLKRVDKFQREGIKAIQIIPPVKDIGEWVTMDGVENVIREVLWRM